MTSPETTGPGPESPGGPAAGGSALERFFEISERGSTVGSEVRGGLVTFVAMSYIVVLNPLILGSFSATDPSAKRDVLGAILPVPEVAAVTALVAGVMTLLFGLVANYPFAIATGLGINTLLAVTIAAQVSWPEAMGLVLIDGVIIVRHDVPGHAVPEPLVPYRSGTRTSSRVDPSSPRGRRR
jgi:AGZA family xanthine/uracil permease-like MFS transporter